MAELTEAELKLQAAKNAAEAEAKRKEEEAAAAAAAEGKAKGLSEEDIIKAVEKARSEEKDKLYPQIDALKESLKEIQDALKAEREEKETIKRNAEEKAEAERKAKLSESEQTQELLRKIEEQLTAEREARAAMENRLAEDARKNALRSYRANALKAAGDEIEVFTDFIKGDTEAEIDSAIATAKARAAELAEKFKTDQGTRVREGMPKSGIPDTAALEEQDLQDLQNSVDMKKYNADPAYRRAVQDQLARAYETTGRI